MSIKKNTKKLDIHQWQSVLYTIYKALEDSSQKAIHLEDIAITNKANFPSFFGWSKYPEYIDLRQVMRTLDKLKLDGFLLGSNTSNWSLSKKGYDYAEKMSEYDLIKATKLFRGNSDFYKRELNRIILTDAFSKYPDSQDSIIDNDLRYLFRIDAYNNSSEAVNKNYQKLLIATKNNKDLIKFIESMFEMILKREIIQGDRNE